MYSSCLRLVPASVRGANGVCPKRCLLLPQCTRVFPTLQNTIITNNCTKISKSSLEMLKNVKFKIKNELFRDSGCLEPVSSRLKTFTELLMNDSVKIVESCAESVEYVSAHAIRRVQQALSLYRKLWDDVSFRRLAGSCPLSSLLMGAVLGGSFDWNKERIPDNEILKFSAEMSLIDYLKNKRKACLDQVQPASECTCTVCAATDSEWQMYLEQPDVAVWRREDVNHRGEGLYCYKMYARYDDVTAYDFLEAQIDLDYRLAWDTNAVILTLIETEPSTNSDLIYWETKWPTMFSNRDYVFKRRYRVDKKRNLLFLANQISSHPSHPPKPGKQRITEYWSYMVIKPKTDFNKPGLEFSLTYFENPGAKVPASLQSKLITSTMPDSMQKLRVAAMALPQRRGGKPSFLSSKDSCTGEKLEDEGRRRPKPAIIELLKGTMFLF